MRTRVSDLLKTQNAEERFSDFDVSFTQDPLTGKLKKLVNDDSVRQAVKNRILTIFGEHFYDPTFGSLIYNSLFEPNDSFFEETVKNTVANSLQNESRVSLLSVDIDQTDEIANINIKVTILSSNTVVSIPLIIKKIR